MGVNNWNSTAWQSYAATNVQGQSASTIYKSSFIQDKYNPAMITLRESRDSLNHPNSTPIILGLDVTGSMDSILEDVAAGLGRLVEGIYAKNPVADPQVMFAAIGDLFCDRAPLQITQFESDITIATQLTDLWFERGGGGNGAESYPAVWAFANRRIETDNFAKRSKKGFIFTMGDDGWPPILYGSQLARLGLPAEDMKVEKVLEEATKKWEIFHLCLRCGEHRYYGDEMFKQWKTLLGERAIPITDHSKIPEIIISLLQSLAGVAAEDIVKGWDGSTAVAVATAINGLTPKNTKKGIVTFQ